MTRPSHDRSPLHRSSRRGVLLALLLSSCISTTTDRRRDLQEESPKDWKLRSYRVAIIPLQPEELNVLPGGDGAAGLAVDYERGAAHVTENLAAVLKDYVFNDVVVLAGDPELRGKRGEDAAWVLEARERGADLILDIEELTYATEPDSSGLWTSYALFLTGPLEMVFPDRKYKFPGCSMEAALYDARLLPAPPAASVAEIKRLLGGTGAGSNDDVDDADDADARRLAGLVEEYELDRNALLHQFRARPETLRLRYYDRVPDGVTVGPLLKSFFIPTARMATKGDYLEDQIAERLAISLAEDLALQVIDGDYEFIDSPSPTMARFRVLSETAVFDDVAVARGALQGPCMRVQVAVDIHSAEGFADGAVRYGDVELPLYFTRGSVESVTRDDLANRGARAVAQLERKVGEDAGRQWRREQLTIHIPLDDPSVRPTHGSWDDALIQLDLTDDFPTRSQRRSRTLRLEDERLRSAVEAAASQ